MPVLHGLGGVHETGKLLEKYAQDEADFQAMLNEMSPGQYIDHTGIEGVMRYTCTGYDEQEHPIFEKEIVTGKLLKEYNEAEAGFQGRLAQMSPGDSLSRKEAEGPMRYICVEKNEQGEPLYLQGASRYTIVKISQPNHEPGESDYCMCLVGELHDRRRIINPDTLAPSKGRGINFVDKETERVEIDGEHVYLVGDGSQGEQRMEINPDELFTFGAEDKEQKDLVNKLIRQGKLSFMEAQ